MNSHHSREAMPLGASPLFLFRPTRLCRLSFTIFVTALRSYPGENICFLKRFVIDKRKSETVSVFFRYQLTVSEWIFGMAEFYLEPVGNILMEAKQMKRMILSCIIFAAAVMPALPSAQTNWGNTIDARTNIFTDRLPFEDCFASDPGAGNTNKTDHANWARRQSLDTLISNLWAKIVMVYGCTVVSGDQAAKAFGEISSLIARRAPDARCFNGDRGIINTDATVHENWARTKTRKEVRDNLGAKAVAALKCLNEGNNRIDFFAEASAMLARVPGGATAASSGNCNSETYSLAGIDPPRAGQQFTVNWTAPRNHSLKDWIGIYRAGDPIASTNITAWQYVPTGPCGYLVFHALPVGEYYVYYFKDFTFNAAGGGVKLTIR